MSKIHLHIEELSLPGYTPAERREFLAALEREIAASANNNIAKPGLTARNSMHLAASDPSPQSMAKATARSLFSRPGKDTVK